MEANCEKGEIFQLRFKSVTVIGFKIMLFEDTT